MPRWALLGTVLVIALGAAIVFPLFTRLQGSGPVSPHSRCLSNIKSLSLAVAMYVTDYDRVPDPRAWSDQLVEYIKNLDTYRCPQAPDLRCAYAFNDGAADATNASLEGPTARYLVTIFESDRGWNAHGGPELLPAVPRHLDGEHFAFLDGHALWVKRGDATVPLQWQLGSAAPPREGAGK
jgi:hypothetical protein